MEKLDWSQAIELFARVDQAYLDKCREVTELRKQLEDYKSTGLEPEKIEELKEKNTAQKMHRPTPNTYSCPECMETLNPMWDYCPWCGQRVTFDV